MTTILQFAKIILQIFYKSVAIAFYMPSNLTV